MRRYPADDESVNPARTLGEITTRNFFGPLQTIVPWASNRYTEALIERARAAFGEQFWGFWMLGGMSGGGMGFIVAPEIKATAQIELQRIMLETKRELQTALPFAMDPVVYDFAINRHGTVARLLDGEAALMPAQYYALHVPNLIRQERGALSPQRRAELERFGVAARVRPELRGMTQALFDRLLPQIASAGAASGDTLQALLTAQGFDRAQHEQIRADMRAGRIGLAQNRLSANVLIEDVFDDDVTDLSRAAHSERQRAIGVQALRAGTVGVLSLAGGAGSRWTQGAGVVKALHPFARMAGKHRSFVEVHLAKSMRIAREHGAKIPHVFTTSYLTHAPIERAAQALATAAGEVSAVSFARPGGWFAHGADGARSAFCV